MDEVVEAPSPRGRRPGVRFSAEVARAICRRVAAGETIQRICSDEGMPNRGTVTAWAKAHGRFRRALARAQTLGGWDHERGGGRRSSYCEAMAMEIFARLSLGEPMTTICRDPTMPSQSTVALWRARYPEFAERVARARGVQAEQFCDLGWEIASAVTPATAYATEVKLRQLRWTAAGFGRHRPVEAETTLEREAAAPAQQAGPVVWTVRHFKVEHQPDGTRKVVAYLRDSRTGELRREHPEDGPADRDEAPVSLKEGKWVF